MQNQRPPPEDPQRFGRLPQGSTHLDDTILLFEDCTGQWTLLAIVEPIGIRTVLQQETDEASMAVVGREHDLVMYDVSH